MKKKLLYIVLPFLVIITGCGENKKEDKAEAESETTVKDVSTKYSSIDPSVSSQLGQIVQHYIHVKNALVQSNITEAKSGAEGILKAISAVDTTKLAGDQLSTFTSEVAKIKSHSNALAQSTDLTKQRVVFNDLTSSVYELVKAFGGGKQLYYQYCPMANDNNGGYWISETEEVNNPYFGDEMLHCGEVKETLK